MDFLTSKRLITTALILLVILNVSLLSVLWWQNMHTPRPAPVTHTREISRSVYFSIPLSLTEKQTESFRELRKQHFLKVRPEMEAITNLKVALVEESFNATPDTIKIANMALALGSRQAKIETELAMHFHDLAEVCTPAQRDSLKAVLEQLATKKLILPDPMKQPCAACCPLKNKPTPQ